MSESEFNTSFVIPEDEAEFDSAAAQAALAAQESAAAAAAAAAQAEAALAALLIELENYLALAGGTMLGKIVLDGDPISGLHAATKQYVDLLLDAFLQLAGGTMLGTLVLAADPVNPLEAATKAYVDASVTSGFVTFDFLEAALEDYYTKVEIDGFFTNYYTSTEIDTLLTGYPTDAELTTILTGYPTDGELTTILTGYPTDAELATILASYATDAEVATLLAGYVTSGALTTALADYLLKAGGTMTGLLTLSGAPTVDLHASTKKYVDDRIAVVNQYDISCFMPALGTVATEKIFMFVADTAFSLISGRCYTLTNSTANKDYDIQVNGVSKGTAAFTAATAAGTVTISTPVAIAAGDRITILGPATVDTTLKEFTITLAGTM